MGKMKNKQRRRYEIRFLELVVRFGFGLKLQWKHSWLFIINPDHVIIIQNNSRSFMNFNEFLFLYFLYKMIADQPKTHLEPRFTAFYRGQTRLTKTTHRLITFCYELMIRVLTGNDSLFMKAWNFEPWVWIIAVALEFYI